MNPLLLFFMIFILPNLVSALSPGLEKAFTGYNQEPGAELIRKRVLEGLDSTNEAGFSPLMEASFNGYTGIVSALLREGADPSLKTKNGKTALTWAIQKGHNEICALLLEALASKNSEKASPKKPPPRKEFS